MWELLKELFATEPVLTPEAQNNRDWATGVKHSNWLGLHQMGREENLTPGELFDKIAEAYCYCYAAGVEPTRDAEWTAFKKTLENLHYPLMSQAITHRNSGK